MLELEVTPGWDKIPQIEKNTPLRGGPDGELNAQAIALAKRTEQLDAEATAISARRYVSNPVDGVTSNQEGMVAAVAAAYARGVPLSWPAGTYVSTGKIPNFHAVRHIGPGVIKRGSETYAVQPKGKSTKTNVLYVSKTGSADNDGLSPDQPMLTIQQAFDALANAGQVLAGNWHVSIAAGIYNEFSTLSGILFKNRLRVFGPEVAGGVPSVIIDGTGLSAQSLNGMLLSDGIFAVVRDIKFINWNGGSGVGPGDASSGLNVSGNCNVWTDNVHGDQCGTAVAATRSRIYQGRGVVSNCDTGSTAFANTTCSYGYGGATTYSGCAQAINIRDGSAGVVDGGVLTNNAIGIKVTNQSHTRVSNCSFTNSGTADIYLYTGSSCFFGAGNTHTPGKKLRGEFALDLANAYQIFFNADTKRFNFGELGTPGYQFHFRNSTTGSFASSAAMMALEADSPQLALNGGSSGTFGLLCAIPGTSSAASLLYTAADGNWRLRVNNVDSYRFASTTFRPVVDNGLTLGLAANRWSTIYAATGTINTSDKDAKDSIQDIQAAALRAARRISFKQFKFKDALVAKGDGARWHFGVIAQEVKAAFEAEGLDPFEYGVLCYDEWPDQFEPIHAERTVIDEDGSERIEEYDTGEQRLVMAAGSRYGVRYEELFSLKLAAMDLN